MKLCDEIIRRKWSIRNLQPTCPSKMIHGRFLTKMSVEMIFATQISVCNKSWEFCDRISVRNDPCEISTDISISNF